MAASWMDEETYKLIEIWSEDAYSSYVLYDVPHPY